VRRLWGVGVCAVPALGGWGLNLASSGPNSPLSCSALVGVVCVGRFLALVASASWRLLVVLVAMPVVGAPVVLPSGGCWRCVGVRRGGGAVGGVGCCGFGVGYGVGCPGGWLALLARAEAGGPRRRATPLGEAKREAFTPVGEE